MAWGGFGSDAGPAHAAADGDHGQQDDERFPSLANAGFMTIRIDQKVHPCTITSSEADSDLAGAVRAGESVDKLGQYPVFLRIFL